MADTAPHALAAHDLKLRYGATEVLHGVDLTIAQGEKVVLLGPSGSGKSSLLRCFNGLEWPQAGSIEVLGMGLTPDEKRLRSMRLRMEMIFQSFNLYTNRTALQNVALAPRFLLGMSYRDAEVLALSKLDELGIADLADAYPFQLSGGQQQRVAIARALAKKPDILLLDEPTSALDPELVQSVLDTIEQVATVGLTVACVTHELGFARRLADRAVFMDGGLIVEQGPPEKLFAAPESPRLAQFLRHIMH